MRQKSILCEFSKSFKIISNRTLLPKYGQYCDDEIQGQSFSQGQSKDSVGISTSIILLPIKCVSIGGTVVKKFGGILVCVWID